ncbi:MAG: hypothetical protein J0H98_07095 [Solirubrobacterales bacterium]|nr:hypothetical protein [Solirubrobacterales bacterium]
MPNRTVDTAAETRRGPAVRPRLRSALLFGALTFGFVLAFLLPDLVAPAHAQAAIDIPNPLDGADDLIKSLNPAGLAEDAIDKAGEVAAKPIKEAFFWMMNQIFGGIQATLSVKLLVWLTTLPDFSGGQVRQIARAMQIVAGAFLSCVLTLSIIRFWLGSYTSGGGFSSGLEGLGRTAIAALLIGLWPKLFSMGVSLTNALSSSLLNDAAKDRLENLFQGLDMATLGITGVGAAGGAVGIFIGAGISMLVWIFISVASVGLFLALIMMKIIVTAGTVIAFVAMPLALVLWPIPETSWIANMLAKAIAVLLAIPVIWILVFSAASAVGADVFFLSNNGKNANFLETGLNILLIKPLVACALLYLAIRLPSRLLQMAPLMGGGHMPGSRFANSVTSYATYRGLEKVSGPAMSSAQGALGSFNSPGPSPMGTGASGSAGVADGQDRGNQQSAARGGGTDQASSQRAAGQAGRAAGVAAGAAATGGVAAAGAGAAGGAAGAQAGAAAGGEQAAQQAAPNPTRVSAPAVKSTATPVAAFEQAPPSMKDGKGGPAVITQSTDRRNLVNGEQNRMNSMPESQRPPQPQVQAAWNSLNDSPQAQAAIRNASSDPVYEGKTPPELASWSMDTGNPHWGTDSMEASRIIGEASPATRESVVTQGQGYGSAGGASTSGGGPERGSSTPTPRPSTSVEGVPDATAEQPRTAARKGAN